MPTPCIPDFGSAAYFDLWREEHRLNAESHALVIEARTYSRLCAEAAEASQRDYWHGLEIKTLERELGVFLRASAIRFRLMQSQRRTQKYVAPDAIITPGDFDLLAYHLAHDPEHNIYDYDLRWDETPDGEETCAISFSAGNSTLHAEDAPTCDDEADWFLGMLDHRAAGRWQCHASRMTTVYTRTAVHITAIYRRIDPENPEHKEN